ncbi:o-succinylbenzoate--CoA ligase [Bacillus sp. 03113]|uniref:o-succinylbenzoate--CoA ligase n=1 Tax=Bacillus sp. 03113 TaxID=2578211 RepID=UPI0015E884AD|nr:o-succinylbenzoate--CoA ligase [Bacillus sp. 03113]
MQEFIPNFLIKRAYLTPDRTAIVYKGTSLTFAELYQRSYQYAGKLTKIKVEKDQFIGVLMKNDLDSVVILLALQLLGATAVILNNRLTSTELSWQLEDSKSVMLITENAFSEKIMDLQKELSELRIISKEKLILGSFQKPIITEEVHSDELCTVMYTSGTTGYPKGVLQTYGNHWWSAIGSSLNLGISEDDCWLCAVPLFHISGFSILMRGLIYGIKIVLHDSFHERKTIEDIKNEKVTMMSVVTTMLNRIVKELKSEKLPKTFRCMLLGGGPASLHLLQACVAKDIPVFQSYGMTETASQIVSLSSEDSTRKLGSAGKPLFPSQLKIVNEKGEEMARDKVGEIVVKGPNVTSGYLNREEETKRKIINGWLYTGDIGYLDREGFLYVLDRRADLIISGGENIYPAEVEGVLVSYPTIKDAGVIGIKDDHWGEIPFAFLVVKNGTLISEEDITQYCLQKLAKYKVPKKYLFIEEIPRNASKKIIRRQLRDLYCSIYGD